MAGTPRLALAAQPVFNEHGFGSCPIHAGIRPIMNGRSDLCGPLRFGVHARVRRRGAPGPCGAGRHLADPWHISDRGRR